jgi:hypothetical protein
MAAATVALQAQWLNYPEPGTPATRDGKPNLTAKTPRTPDRHPDLSGVWHIEPPSPGEIERLYGDVGPAATIGDDARLQSRYYRNMFIEFKPAEEPITPAAAALTAKNREHPETSPAARCLPYGLPDRYFNFRPFKIFQTPRELAFFYEVDGAFRQVHTDNRKLPADPFPSWMGYSTGKWEGDTLVVDTAGFNDKSWLDVGGHPHSEALRVHERFHRRDFGHMDMEVRIEDPVMLTKPMAYKFTELLIPNSDVLENFCAEGERDQSFMNPATQ